MYKEKIVDAITGEETWRDYTKEEIQELEKNQAQIQVKIAEAAQKEAAKQAILEKLGLTADEAAVLFG